MGGCGCWRIKKTLSFQGPVCALCHGAMMARRLDHGAWSALATKPPVAPAAVARGERVNYNLHTVVRRTENGKVITYLST